MKTYETKRQCLIAVISTAAILCGAAAQAAQSFVNVADFVAADGKADAADGIQRLIETIQSFHNIVGVMHGTRAGKPSKSLYPVLNCICMKDTATGYMSRRRTSTAGYWNSWYVRNEKVRELFFTLPDTFCEQIFYLPVY